MQQINPYLSKKPLAVGIKLIVKGFCRAYLSGLSLSWNISTVNGKPHISRTTPPSLR